MTVDISGLADKTIAEIRVLWERATGEGDKAAQHAIREEAWKRHGVDVQVPEPAPAPEPTPEPEPVVDAPAEVHVSDGEAGETSEASD